MMQASNQISGLGVTLYTESYTAIEMIGNIQLTAWLVFALAMVWPWVCKQAGKTTGRTGDVIWFTIFASSFATLVISTFVRIWL